MQVLDCGKYRGQFVLAMEYVDGMSLSQLLGRATAPLELGAVAYLGAELAAALDYLHSRLAPDGTPLRLVHCDVNPPNVLLSRRGEVKLGDLGVARAMGSTTGPLGHRFAGKVTYASPEQLRGGALDGSTDLFALGVTLSLALYGPQAGMPAIAGTPPTAEPAGAADPVMASPQRRAARAEHVARGSRRARPAGSPA